MPNNTVKSYRIAFIGPLGGARLATGMVAMTKAVQDWTLPGHDVSAKFFSWRQWRAAGEWLEGAEVRAVVGYSSGANAAAWIGASTRRRTPTRLDLLIGLDPTIWLDRPPLPPSVTRAHYFWNGNFLPFPTQIVGHGRYRLAPGNTTTRLTSNVIFDFHGRVDRNPRRQQAIYAMLRAVVS